MSLFGMNDSGMKGNVRKARNAHNKLEKNHANSQVGMINSLTHLSQEIENMCVVVQDGTFRHVVIKRALRLSVKSIVKIFLPGKEKVNESVSKETAATTSTV